VAEKPSAPNLYHFARRGWLAGLLDPQRIAGPDYFGNTALRGGEMIGFVKENFGKRDADDKKDLESAVATLSAEAGLKSQQDQDARDTSRIAEGKKLLLDTYGCTDCHRYAGKGSSPKAPDLNGYGSRDWLTRIISNPADSRCYGKLNDRMPAYGESATDPGKNVLSPREIGMLADWLRDEWYEGK
jgi:mono/diheme cytochrome c family protein